MKRIIQKIRQRYPEMRITIRADSGFSCPGFYPLADQQQLYFVVGITSNAVLKQQVQRVADAVEHRYVTQGENYQHFIGFAYQAGSWHAPQQCYSKIESTGKGLNVRHMVRNLPEDQLVEDGFLGAGQVLPLILAQQCLGINQLALAVGLVASKYRI